MSANHGTCCVHFYLFTKQAKFVVFLCRYISVICKDFFSVHCISLYSLNIFSVSLCFCNILNGLWCLSFFNLSKFNSAGNWEPHHRDLSAHWLSCTPGGMYSPPRLPTGKSCSGVVPISHGGGVHSHTKCNVLYPPASTNLKKRHYKWRIAQGANCIKLLPEKKLR